MYDFGTAKIIATHQATWRAATRDYDLHTDRPQSVTFEIVFPTLADAETFVAQFPKSLGFSASTLYGQDNKNYGFASMGATLVKSGVVGEKNETGIKRYRRAMTLLEKAGVPVVWGEGRMVNAYTSREAFEAAL